MRKWFVLSAMALSLTAEVCRADSIDSLLLFGDSYFDTGAGNAVATSMSLPLPNPTPPYFEGRHSNGPIWIDYASQLIDLPFTNYAVSGSETGYNNLTEPPLGGLFQQIGRYEAFHSKIPENRAVVMDGGGNDFFSLLSTPSMLNPAGIAAQIEESIGNIVHVFTELQALGAKKTIMWNLGDMGMLPLFTDPALGLTPLAPVYSGISKAYNAALLQVAQTFNKFSTDHKQIYIFDAFSVFNEIAAELQAQGVNLTEHTLTTLPGGGYVVTGPQPDQVAFYDQVHPTTKVWELIADPLCAYLDALLNGARFVAAQQEIAFQSARAHNDLIENHFRTLHYQRYANPYNCYPCYCPTNDFRLYAEGEGKWGRTQTRSGACGIDFSTGLALIGLDYNWNDCLNVGFSFTSQTSHAHVSEGRGRIEVEDNIPTLYANLFGPNYFIDADLSYHFYEYSRIRRNIPFVDKKAHAKTHGNGIEFNIDFGCVSRCSCFTLIPLIGLEYQHLIIHRYREHGPRLYTLQLRRQHQNSLIVKVGGQAFWSYSACLSPFIELYYEHEFLRDCRRVNPRFANSNDNSVNYSDIGHPRRDSLNYSLGIQARLAPRITGNISYQGDTTFEEYANAFRVELDVVF